MTVPASLAVVGGYGSLRFASDGLGAGGFSMVSIRAMNQPASWIAPAMVMMYCISKTSAFIFLAVVIARFGASNFGGMFTRAWSRANWIVTSCDVLMRRMELSHPLTHCRQLFLGVSPFAIWIFAIPEWVQAAILAWAKVDLFYAAAATVQAF